MPSKRDQARPLGNKMAELRDYAVGDVVLAIKALSEASKLAGELENRRMTLEGQKEYAQAISRAVLVSESKLLRALVTLGQMHAQIDIDDLPFSGGGS